MRVSWYFWTAAPIILLVLNVACSGPNTKESTPPNLQETPFPSFKIRHENHVFVGGTPPPAQPMANPYQGDPSAVEAGRTLFRAMHCDGCHADRGAGAIGPSLADGRWRYGGSAAEIFESIYAGRPNGMPAYGGVLSEEAIWKLVSYLHSLTPATDPATLSF